MSTSANPSTSLAPAFPRVGDTFPSLNEFKLACHRAALHAGVELPITSGDATRAHLNCRLRENCTVRKISGDKNCTFRITACQQDGTDGRIGVVERALEHSCPRNVRKRRRSLGETEAWTSGKIEELEEAIRKGQTLPPKVSWRRTVAKPASSSEFDIEDEANTSTEDEENDEEDDPSVGFYPSAAEVSGEVADLLKAGAVAFPARRMAFSTARELLITLYAFAQARGFTIYRKSDVSDKQHLRLICGKGHNRYAYTEQGQCEARFTAAADSSGLKHNHEIDEVDDDEQASPHSSSREGASTASNRPKREADRPPVQHAAFLPFSTPSTPTPLHRDDLAAFLYSTFPAVPAHELQLVVNFLAHIGISTLEDLATLMILETTSIRYLVNAVQLPSLNSLEQAVMRAALHRCLETIRQQAKADLCM